MRSKVGLDVNVRVVLNVYGYEVDVKGAGGLDVGASTWSLSGRRLGTISLRAIPRGICLLLLQEGSLFSNFIDLVIGSYDCTGYKLIVFGDC
jgi:hypothetical protein